MIASNYPISGVGTLSSMLIKQNIYPASLANLQLDLPIISSWKHLVFETINPTNQEAVRPSMAIRARLQTHDIRVKLQTPRVSFPSPDLLGENRLAIHSPNKGTAEMRSAAL